MRPDSRVTIHMVASLDGFIARKDGRVDFDPALRFTFTIEAGKATKVTLLQGGVTIEGPRVP